MSVPAGGYLLSLQVLVEVNVGLVAATLDASRIVVMNRGRDLFVRHCKVDLQGGITTPAQRTQRWKECGCAAQLIYTLGRHCSWAGFGVAQLQQEHTPIGCPACKHSPCYVNEAWPLAAAWFPRWWGI
jgi:hypothetical protein